MSYILEALRRADSEREDGPVPGLHSQPPPADAYARRRTRALPWIATGVGIGLAVPLAVYFVLRETPRASTASIPAAAPAVAASAPAPARPPEENVATPAAPPAAKTAEPALPAGSTTRAPDPLAPVAPPAPWPSSGAKAATKDGAKAAPREATKDAAKTPAPPIVPRDKLPEPIRAQLPPLAVGGSMYSSVPANRSLIIDGQLLRENERVTPDLVLEEIRLKSAVLNFKGHRFEISF